MTHLFRRIIRLALLMIVALPVLWSWSSALAQTAEPTRSGRWELLLAPQYTLSRNLGFQGGTTANINETWGFGMQLNYNFNEHVSLGGLLSWNRPDYNATVQPAAGNPTPATRSISGTLETTTLGMVLTYNILAGPLTPYVDAMVSGTYIDTNIASGPPVAGCFWDPWYGYICGTSQPTKYDTVLSYGFGGGLRWDINTLFVVRGGFRQQFVDLPNTSTPSFTTFKLDLGVKF